MQACLIEARKMPQPRPLSLPWIVEKRLGDAHRATSGPHALKAPRQAERRSADILFDPIEDAAGKKKHIRRDLGAPPIPRDTLKSPDLVLEMLDGFAHRQVRIEAPLVRLVELKFRRMLGGGRGY